MKELRCIVFTDRELLAALLDRRQRLKQPIPDGDITAVKYDTSSNGIRTLIEIDGGKHVVAMAEEEVQSALIAYCMAKGIPLPADAEKTLYVIRGNATLMITMNFRKPARLVAMQVGLG